MARPRFKITNEKRKTVTVLAGYGLTHEQIARMIKIRSPKTLRKYFRSELEGGSAEANAQVAQTLFKMATSGKHPGSTIFWVNRYARLAERALEEQRPVATPTLIISREADDEPSGE
jgi:hypothetical protein